MENRDIENEPLYWRGRVDAQLENIQEMLRVQITHWAELQAWRADTDRRLERGAQHFVSHDGRIDILENSLKEHRENITRHVSENHNEKYLTWPWIMDNIIIYVIRWGLILFLGYLIVNAIQVSP